MSDSNQNPKSDRDPAAMAQAAADQAKNAAKDALGVFQKLMFNPVAGIGEAYAGLSGSAALGVGIVFGVVAAILVALTAGMMVGALMGAMMGFPGMGGGFSFGDFIKAVFSSLVLIAAIGGSILFLAPVFGGRGSLPGSFFVAGASYLPLSIAMFLSWIILKILSNTLGFILALILLIFGLCFLVLVVNAGLRKIGEVGEERAALATPAVLALAVLASGLVARLLS